MQASAHTSTLLDQAREWSDQARSVLMSRQVLSHRNLLVVLALGSCTGLLLGGHSLFLLWQGASQVRSPGPLLLGGVTCAALWFHAFRRGMAPQGLLLAVSAALCASNVVAIGLNGLVGLTFVVGIIVMIHLLLELRRALLLATVYLLGVALGVWWFDGPLDSGLYLRSISSGAASTAAMQLLARYWNQIGDRFHRLAQDMTQVIQRTEAEIERVRQEAALIERTDLTTGLPNALGFQEQAAQRLPQHPRALFGHIHLLRWRSSIAVLNYSEQRTLTSRLVGTMSEILGEQALLARIGPDDFALLLPGAGPQGDNAVDRLGALHEALLRPVVVGSLTALTEPLVGYSRCPSDGHDVTQLLRQAELACRSSEGSQNHVPQPFELLLERRLSEQEQTAKALHQAFDLEQLGLDLHPIVQAQTRRVFGAEARVVWAHPQRGRVPTAGLLPRTAVPSLTERATLWKLRTAAAQAALITHGLGRPFALGVNLPTVWLQQNIREPEAFLEQLLALRLTAQSLCLEIPEESLIGDIADLSQWMTTVRSLGVGLAIDHFGAGLSCVSHLDRLPVNSLKMDRSFVARVGQGSREAAVCRGIVRVAREQGLQVVAEGVLSAEQGKRLADIGCDLLQGPGVAPTLPAEQALPWMASQP